MTTVASALWRCIDKPGHDFCQLRRGPSGWTLDGVSVFLHDSQPAMIWYSVECNPRWEAVSGLIRGSMGSRAIHSAVTRRNGAGTLTELPQIYQLRSDHLIWYEAPTVGYRGLLELDANGFTRRYPGLWEAETEP